MRRAVPLECYKTCPEANLLEQVAGPWNWQALTALPRVLR